MNTPTEQVPKLTIWHFIDAPQEYRDLSEHGGDEDWVLHCPAEATNSFSYWPAFLGYVIDGGEDYLDSFGHVDRHVLDNGDIVIIFAHA